MKALLVAQALGEYAGGGGGVAAELGGLVQTAGQWLQLSLREQKVWWIAAALLFALWAFRRR